MKASYSSKKGVARNLLFFLLLFFMLPSMAIAQSTVRGIVTGEFYQFNLSSCIRQQNSLTAQFVSFSLSNLANIFYPPNFYNN